MSGLSCIESVQRVSCVLFDSNKVLLCMRSLKLLPFRSVVVLAQVDDGLFEVPISSQESLEVFRSRLDDSLAVDLGGREMRLASTGPLEGIPECGLAEALMELTLPTKIELKSTTPPNCGEDHVCAVNLARAISIEQAPDPGVVDRAFAAVTARYPGAAGVELSHFLGGPCDDTKVVSCIVLGGGGCGWTVVNQLEDAIELAYSRAAVRSSSQGNFGGGATVKIDGLKARPDLNGELGVTLRFDERAGRWTVRLRNGEGKRVRPQNLEPVAGAHGRVYVFHGDARWSRAQLLGEIAKGHWGLCKASVSDLTLPVAERWGALDGRLAFAPVTEMTEPFIQADAEAAMVAVRAEAQRAAQDGDHDVDEVAAGQ
jgi:hypothetical protein